MKRSRKVNALMALMFSTYSAFTLSHEPQELKQRVARLESTVEELTFKLSAALEQRNNLRTAMSQALQAKQEGKPVVVGCDTSALRKEVAYSSFKGYTLERWVTENASKCTELQLQQILSDYKNYLQASSRSALRYELSVR